MDLDRDQHSVTRIVLPSGQSVEVVHLGERSQAPARAGLHICPACHSELVQPVEWSQAAGDRWQLDLRCPNCARSWRGLYDQDQVAEFEERLEQGVEAILRDLHRLTSANMADEIARFVAALQADLILPEDF